MKKALIPLAAIVVALAFLFAVLAPAAPQGGQPWQTQYVRTFEDPSNGYDHQIVLPTMPAAATWVRVDIATETDWYLGVEGTDISDAWGYMSWNYYAHGRYPYPSEIGQPGDGYETCTVYWNPAAKVTLTDSTMFFDVGKCLTSIGTEPKGPYDNVLDYDGSYGDGTGSGGWCADDQEKSTTGTSTSNSSVLAGLKAGDDLYLNFTILGHAVLSLDPFRWAPHQDIIVTVTWGGP